MADVNVKVQVNSNLPEVNKDAEKVEKTLNRIASTSARIPKAVAAAQQGVAASNAAKSGQGETKTARSVGAGGGTGSAASDFAAQAQGLGGLVHVYATFAANLFAISAGFNALSKSMDNVNLVKGLDQIGAASGRNLGSLAKQMVAVADGAISLRDAMTSTALASSGGMTNAAILRMTEVAKKASLALGRDLPDSMERLTKGIVKIQPELLDELGIMARVIPAQQNYAREIGKTIGALTDFEKRQAFANAVLAEGEKKFGAIALDANPYSKVLASIQNLMQSGLELVNKVLGPLMSALSASPAGLAIALGGLATMLLKQAIPALGMFRENAKRMEAETHARILRQVDEQSEAASQSDQIAANAAEKKFRTEDSTLKSISKLHKRFNREIVDAAGGTGTRELLRKSPFDLSTEDIDRIKSAHTKLSADTATIEQKTQAGAIKFRLDGIESIRNKMVAAGDAAADANERNDARWYSHQEQKAKILDRLNKTAAKRTVLSNAADNAAIMGPAFAMSKLREEVNALDAGKFSKAMTTIRGSLSIATSAISTAMNAFGIWAQVIGLVIAGIAILDHVMSTSAKEAKAFEGAIDTLNSSFANIDRTLDLINKKDITEFLSVVSIQAKATALDDLGGSLSGVVAKFLKLQQAQSGWDQFFDGFWDMFGKGSADKLALGVSTSVIDAMRLLEEGPAKDVARKTLQEIIGGQPLNFTNIKEFNERIKDLDKNDVGNIGKRISDALAVASRSASNAAATLTAFKTALGEVSKQASVLSNSLMPTDDISKMGIALNTAASSLSVALQDPINGLVALKELAEDTKSLSFIDPSTALSLGSARKELENIISALGEAKKQQKASEAKVSEARAIVSKDDIRTRGDKNVVSRPEVKAARDTLLIEEEKFNIATKRIAVEQSNADVIREKFSKTAQMLAAEGYKNLAMGLTKALGESAVTAAKGYLDIIKSAGGNTAEMDAELSKKQIAVQIQDIQMKYANTLALSKLTLGIERNSIVHEQAMLEDKIARAQDARKDTTKLDEKLVKVNAALNEVELAIGISGTGSKGVRAYAKAATMEGATPELVAAMSKLPEVILQSFGKDSALAKLSAEMGNAELQRKAGIINDASSRANKALDVSGKGLAVEASDIANMQAVQSSYSAALNSRKEMLAIKELELKADKDINTLMAQYDTQALVLMKYKEGTKEYAEAFLVTERILNELSSSLADKEEKLAGIRQKSLQDRLIGEESLRRVEANRLNTSFQSYMDIELARIAQKDSELAYLRDIGAIEASTFTLKQGELALDALNISNAKEIAEVNRKYTEDRIAAENTLKSIQEANRNRAPDRAFDTTAETAALKEINDEHNKQITKLGIINDTKKDSIKLTAEHKTMQEAHNEAMSKMVSITEGLNTVFGEMGTNLGKIGEAVLKMAQDEEIYYKRKIALEAETAAARADAKLNPEAYKAALNAESKLDKKRTSEELGNMISIAGAAKKMFGERTAAAKMFGAVEKALSVLRIASMIQEAVVALSTVGPVVAAEGAKATAGGITAVINAMKSLPPPFSFIAGAAMAAAVASVLGNSSAGSVTPPGGFGSEDRQKSQGTGQSWVDGKLVDNGGGTFGDSTAKSESIKNSLEIIKETSVEGLSFSNKMLDTLISIDRGVNESAKGLYSVGGLRTGSGFGTEEGKSGKKGFLGIGGKSVETSIIDSGITLKGTFLDLTQAGKNAVSTFENVSVHTTKQGFWGLGGSDKTTFSTNVGALEDKVQDQITSIFAHGRDLFLQVGETLQMSVESIDSILGGVNVDEIASLRGLTGTDLEKEMSSVIGNILDTAAGTLFKKFEKFREFGEGMTETAIRVVDGSNKVHLAFNSIGVSLKQVAETSSSATEDMLSRVAVAEKDLAAAKTAAGKMSLETRGVYISTGGGAESGSEGYTEWITELKPNVEALAELALAEKDLASARKTLLDATTISTVNNFEITEALINSAGGLSNFLEQASSFKESFLTETEQLAPVTKALNDELTKLNIPLGLSRTQFKELVQSFQIVDKASAEAYVSLLNVADEFDVVAKATEEFNKAQRTQSISILKAQGLAQIALNMSRADEIALLDPRLQAGQLLINQLEDEARTSSLNVEILKLTDRVQEATNITRNKELSALSATDAAIQRRIYLLQDEAAILDSIKKVESTRVTVASAYASFVNAAKSSAEALISASQGITKGYLAAKDKRAKAQQSLDEIELSEKSRLASASIEAGKKLKDFADSIREFVKEITFASMDSASQLRYLQKTFDDTVTKARTGDEKALESLTTTATKLLDVGKNSSATYLDFARLTGRTAASLTSVADGLDVKADPLLVAVLGLTDEQIEANEYAKRVLEAQGVLNEANVDLNRWTEAINESGASTEEILDLYVKDWRKASLEDARNQSDLVAATLLIRNTNIKVPTALDGLKDAMTSMSQAISSLASQLGNFAGAVLTAVQNQTISAAEAVSKLASVGNVLDNNKVSSISTGTGSTSVYKSETSGGTALAINNADGKDYTVYGSSIKATGQEIRDWVAKQTDPMAIYNGAVSEGISSNMLAAITGVDLNVITDWVTANKLPAFALGGDHLGGARLVGENGPEIETTGASRIFNARQTRDLLQPDNSELIAEIRLLRREVTELKRITESEAIDAKITAKQLTRWDTDGLPATTT